MKRKALITGGAGFIGSHIADKLTEQGYDVVVVDNLSNGRRENVSKRARFYEADICDSDLFQIFKKEKPDIVFHYAAQINLKKSISDPINSAKTNILGSLNVLENCRKSEVKRVVFASSGGAIYGEAKIIPTPEDYPERPVSPYGIEKLAVEKYLDYYYGMFKVPFVSLRFANVYGPRQNSENEGGVIAIFCNKMLSGQQPVINSDGKQTRDFIFVNDAVEANILAAEKNKVGVFNISSGKETIINTVFDKINDLTGLASKKKYKGLTYKEQSRSCLDNKKASESLKWFPNYSLDRGLKETVDWFKEKL